MYAKARAPNRTPRLLDARTSEARAPTPPDGRRALELEQFAPFIDEDDDRLSQVCQVSLFFTLASKIALRTEQDSSSGVLSALLFTMMALPPVLAFLFESDLDFEKGLHLSAVMSPVGRCLDATVGRSIKWLFSSDDRRERLPPELLPAGGLASEDAEAKTAEDATEAGGRQGAPPPPRARWKAKLVPSQRTSPLPQQAHAPQKGHTLMSSSL